MCHFEKRAVERLGMTPEEAAAFHDRVVSAYKHRTPDLIDKGESVTQEGRIYEVTFMTSPKGGKIMIPFRFEAPRTVKVQPPIRPVDYRGRDGKRKKVGHRPRRRAVR